MKKFFSQYKKAQVVPGIILLLGITILFTIGFAAKCHAQEKQKIVTGAVAVNYDFEVTKGIARIVEVRIHLSAAGGAGDLTFTIDSGHGSEYDVVYLTQDMTTVTDLIWVPTRRIYITPADAFEVDWANANTRTYGIEILYE